MRYVPVMCLMAFALAGCAAPRGNPSFQITEQQADLAMEQMQAHPKPLKRPVVIVGGFLDFGVGPAALEKVVAGISKDARTITVMIAFCQSFDSCRSRIINAVDEAWPNTDPNWTTEVDVIGISLGGLASRYAASPSDNPELKRRLKIARLFTLASPHQGADAAGRVALTHYHRDMRTGSEFLRRLSNYDSMARYEIYPYVHLQDDVVGEAHAAPPGWNPWWLETNFKNSPHLGCIFDKRIHADICRRLRGEKPFTTTPAAALPNREEEPRISQIAQIEK